MRAAQISSVFFVAVVTLCGFGGGAYAIVAHEVVTVYTDSGDPQSALIEGDNLTNQSQIVCPSNLTSCTLVLTVTDDYCSNWLQYFADHFAIRMAVDGKPVGYQLLTQFQSTCRGGMWSFHVQNVSPGTHTVTLYTKWLYKSVPATQGLWTVEYKVLAP
jgi:hypothetical protein